MTTSPPSFNPARLLPHKLAACLLFLTVATQAATAAPQTGKVVRILDGDTIEVLLTEQSQFEVTRIRIAEIDAPESKQDFGSVSRKALSGICFNAVATFHLDKKDRYGRTISSVQCGQIDVASYMVGNGMAWVYRQYSKDETLIGLEDAAKASKKGLWSHNNAQPPWEFRRGH